MFNNLSFAMEKKITCSLHKGYSHFVSDLADKSLIGKKPYLFKLDEIEGLDINSEYEFSFAEFLFKSKFLKY